jgi:predicted signal transduction protein with EAL and GGDEF domain
VRTTVELGRELGRRVVAEGVETPEQCAALIALGCTTAQGFHFSKPMSAHTAVEALRGTAPAARPDPAPARRRSTNGSGGPAPSGGATYRAPSPLS